MAVLNTSTNPFEWSIPLTSSNIGVPSLTAHTADLVGNYMIVAFGKHLFIFVFIKRIAALIDIASDKKIGKDSSYLL